MRYISATKLHARALQVLSVIEDAENRMAYYESLFSLRAQTNFRNELDLWPLGMPNFAPILHKQQITKTAHKRLVNYYNNIVGRIKNLPNDTDN